MISGPGMMDYESCVSYEKMVIDAEILGMAKRMIAGIDGRQTPIALEIMQELGHTGNYLSHPHTKKWFRKEFYLPSEVIDRDTVEAWEKKDSKSAWDRAAERVDVLLSQYQATSMADEVKKELRQITTKAANQFGMKDLPRLPGN